MSIGLALRTKCEGIVGDREKTAAVGQLPRNAFLTQESAEEVKAEAEFALKFKKNKVTKEPLTAETASVLVQRVEETPDELGADVRVCKAHIADTEKKA